MGPPGAGLKPDFGKLMILWASLEKIHILTNGIFGGLVWLFVLTSSTDYYYQLLLLLVFIK